MQLYNSCKEAINNCLSNKSFSIAHLYQEERTMDMHIHDCHEIYYSISGGKQFLIDNKFYDIQPGDLFVINPFESHRVSRLDEALHERIIISIYPDFLNALSSPDTDLSHCFTERYSSFSHRLTLNAEQKARLLYYGNKITSVEGFGSDLYERSAFMELMVMINGLYNIKTRPDYESCQYLYNPQVNDIIKYINQHIQENFTLEHLSEIFFLSPSYICRIFKSATGTTLNKYVIARRITIAKVMLSSGSSLNQAMELCGFNDYNNFIKSFTKAVGISPKKYAQNSTS